MQNKGPVKLFAILFGLVSIYQLSFSFKADQIEDNAKKFAFEKILDSDSDYDAKRVLEQAKYLDSLKNETRSRLFGRRPYKSKSKTWLGAKHHHY